MWSEPNIHRDKVDEGAVQEHVVFTFFLEESAEECEGDKALMRFLDDNDL